jgi:hypothetical protein
MVLKSGIALMCIAAGALLASACAQTTAQAGFTHAGAVAFEAGVRARCPRSPVEVGVLIGLRLAYDAAIAPTMTADQAAELKDERDRTNAACGIAVAPPPVPVPEPAAGPGL